MYLAYINQFKKMFVSPFYSHSQWAFINLVVWWNGQQKKTHTSPSLSIYFYVYRQNYVNLKFLAYFHFSKQEKQLGAEMWDIFIFFIFRCCCLFSLLQYCSWFSIKRTNTWFPVGKLNCFNFQRTATTIIIIISNNIDWTLLHSSSAHFSI